MQQSSYVGIDVSKHHLDVAFPGVTKVWRTPNDASGIAALVRRVRRLGSPHVVCEATGGYTRRLTSNLAAEMVPLSRVNPRQVLDIARATGRLAKTDEPFDCLLRQALRIKLTRPPSCGSLTPCSRRHRLHHRPSRSD